MERFDVFFIVYVAFMLSGIGYLVYSAAQAPPLTYTLVDYWSTNDSCRVLISLNRDVTPSDKLAFIADDGLLIFTYNASIEDVGYLYATNQACPQWLPYAEIHPVDP